MAKIYQDKKYGDLIQAQVWAPPEIWQALKARAVLNNTSMKVMLIEIFTEAAADYLAILEKKGDK